jgi:hypothetical protein
MIHQVPLRRDALLSRSTETSDRRPPLEADAVDATTHVAMINL